MHVDRFAGAELVIYKEQPGTEELDQLLLEAGLTNSTQEQLWVVSYDSIENIRTIQQVAKGGYHELQVPLPPLLAAVLLSGTDRFQVIHNHPSGDTSPTMADVELTHILMAAANACGLYFEDHLIVGPGAEPFSFLRGGLITPSPELLLMAKGERHRRATELHTRSA